MTAAVVIALVITNVLSMVFGELVPKNLAIAEPMGTAKAVVGASRISATVFKPLIWVLNGAANAVLRMFSIEPQEELRSARSPDELSSLVRRSAEQGTLENRTAGLLARSISFSDKTAADVLTPRPRVRFIKSVESADEIIAAAAETGHSRFPVIGEDSDDVLGLVHLKRAVSIPREQRAHVPVSALVSELPVVPETMPLDALLDLLRERGFQMAVVADEYGGTAGVLTLEDVVEELVGEITDEHDPKAKRAERLPDRHLVAARHPATRRGRRDHRRAAARGRRVRDHRRPGAGPARPARRPTVTSPSSRRPSGTAPPSARWTPPARRPWPPTSCCSRPAWRRRPRCPAPTSRAPG